uniref:Uncharacterized protein n=1 Tax=Timema genevievae TaxID=629358 RepID=A0A7R9PRQ4_TIMGE|nr:unnamed protein product [Timema genevievae]
MLDERKQFFHKNAGTGTSGNEPNSGSPFTQSSSRCLFHDDGLDYGPRDTIKNGLYKGFMIKATTNGMWRLAGWAVEGTGCKLCLFDKSVCDVNSVLPFYADWVTSIENGLTPLENFKDFVSLEPKLRYEEYKADMLETYFVAFLCELVQLSIYLFEKAEKLQEYLGMLHLEKLSLARQNVVWKAHLALILLHISKGKDIKEVAQPLVSLVHCHTNDTALMKLFVKDLQHIFELNPTLELSRHVLFENWLLQYLSHTAENSIYQFGQITSFLLALLQNHNFKLTSIVIAENLISFLKNFCADSKSAKCAQVINLAGELTAWSLNQPDQIRSSFIDLFRYFGTSLVVDVKDSQLYLVVLLQKQHALDALIKLIPNCVHLIIKAWIR